MMTVKSAENPTATSRRLEVLRVLEDATQPLSIKEIAGRLAVHPNTVRFHLETLIDNGKVELAPPDRHRPGRPPQMFRVVDGMDRTGPRHYQPPADVLIHQLAAEPEPTARAVEAGREWGRRLGQPPGEKETAGFEEPISRLVSLLDELGFAPERRDEQAQVGARHCPFLEPVERRADIVCPVHLELMQGVMDVWGAPVTVDRLKAFAEPDRRLAHIATVREAS